MPALPLPRFLETFETRREHARKLEHAVRSAGGDMHEMRNVRATHTAVDAIALRGIPAIGRGVAGVIAGTSPGS